MDHTQKISEGIIGVFRHSTDSLLQRCLYIQIILLLVAVHIVHLIITATSMFEKQMQLLKVLLSHVFHL